MKRVKGFIVCALAATIVLSGCGEKVSEAYETGIEEINAGNYYAAIDAFTVVVGDEEESEKNKANALLYTAEANLMLEQYEEAITAYKKALEYDPENTKLLMTLGNVLQSQGKVEDAIEYFELAVSYGDEDVLPSVGAAYMSMDCFEEAKTVLLRYAKNNPLDVKTNYYLSKCSYELGETTAALMYVENALMAANGDYDDLLLYQAAVLYEAAGDWDKALEYMEEYVERCPEDEKAQREYKFIVTRADAVDTAVESSSESEESSEDESSEE